MALDRPSDLEKLKELLSQAVDRDEADRDSFIREAAAGNPELQAELRSLLGMNAGSDSADPLRLPDRDDGPYPRESFPKRIGPFDIEGVLGRGGMGIVYRATNPKAGVPVALKVLQPALETKEFLARFEAERAVLTRFQHRNIAQIYDAGVDPHGPPYLAMELVDGPNLLAHCAMEESSLVERLRLFHEVCQGVHHAHLRGVLHRDLKPSNILVTTEDGRAVPKIIDFGLAKAMRSGPGMPSQSLTAMGTFMGTLEYTSPEQADPAEVDIDTRADVYSLGVILYEQLTGQLPFPEERYRSGSFESTLEMLRNETPASPSLRVLLDQGREDVPADLACLVLKCLEGDRRQRYASAKELADDVMRFLNGFALVARPPSRSYMIRKFTRRHRLAVTAVASITLALVLGLIGTSVGFYREWKRDQELIRTIAELNQSLEDGESMSMYLYSVLSWAQPGRLGPDATIRDATLKVLEIVRQDGKEPDGVRGRVLIAAGRALIRMDDVERGMPALQEGVELIGMPLTDRGLRFRSLALSDIAYAHYHARDLAAAEAAYLAKIETEAAMKEPRIQSIIAAEAGLIGVYIDRGRYWEAAQRQRALIDRAREAGREPAHMGSLHIQLGVALFRSGLRAEGLDQLREGHGLCLDGRSPSLPVPLSCTRSLIAMLLEDLRFDEALPLLEEYAKNVEAGPGPETFLAKEAYALRALARSHTGRDATLERQLQMHLADLETTFPERYLSESLVPVHRVVAELAAGRPDAQAHAEALLARVDARPESLGDGAATRELFGRAWLTYGDSQVATVFLDDARDRYGKVLSAEAPVLTELARLVERTELTAEVR